MKDDAGKENVVAEPHPDNVPGPFYVENGCCISCGIPEGIAPDIFEWKEEELHCFVRCQPGNQEQLDRTLQVMWAGEADCIRYRGTDPSVARRIAEFGSKDCCDFPMPRVAPVERNYVRFRSRVDGDTPFAITGRFREWLTSSDDETAARFRVRKPRWWNRDTVSFYWAWQVTFMPRFNHLRFGNAGGGLLNATVWSGFGPASRAMALEIHRWLDKTEGASQIQWFSQKETDSGAPGLHVPI